ncbi:MAG: hypothetical protein SVS85_02310, partial [Candidatus Nanohaloarchaea archaeon]|nr:hypothetical protein [Candidatus Nanohaloarchaea archaeon]
MKVENFTLTGLRQELRQARATEIGGTTVTLTLPDYTEVDWTFQEGTDTVEKLEEQLDTAEDVAIERKLFVGWAENKADQPISELSESREQELREQFRRRVAPEIRLAADITADLPEEVLDFMDRKEDVPELEQAVEETEELYDQVPQNRRISIAQRLNQVTDSLDEYLDNIDRVEQNLEFEQQVSFLDEDRALRRMENLEDLQNLTVELRDLRQQRQNMLERAQELETRGGTFAQQEAQRLRGEALALLQNQINPLEETVEETAEETGVEPGQVDEEIREARERLERAQENTARDIQWWNREDEPQPVRATVTP